MTNSRWIFAYTYSYTNCMGIRGGNRYSLNRGHPSRDTLHISGYLESDIMVLTNTVTCESLVDDATEILMQIFPEWKTENVSVIQLTGGITNRLLKAQYTGNESPQPPITSVLVRIYGEHSELFIDRAKELINAVSLNEFGLAPPVYARFNNGFVYGYSHGIPLSPKDFQDHHLSKLIAKQVAQWHKSSIAGSYIPNLIYSLELWSDRVPKKYEKVHHHQQFSTRIDMKYIKMIIEFIRNSIENAKSKYPIAFCHNDLLSGNVIYDKEKDKISFIDFEYGGYNYRGFDIANHFCEYAGFECDWSKYPSIQTQKTWISWYIESSDMTDSTEIDISSILEEIRLFTIASHTYWGLWALVQAAHSGIDFDYMGYAIRRIDRLKYDFDRYQNSIQDKT